MARTTDRGGERERDKQLSSDGGGESKKGEREKERERKREETEMALYSLGSPSHVQKAAGKKKRGK